LTLSASGEKGPFVFVVNVFLPLLVDILAMGPRKNICQGYGTMWFGGVGNDERFRRTWDAGKLGVSSAQLLCFLDVFIEH
jgi:hypothetical protein